MQCMTVNPMCLSSALRHHREHAWLPSGSSSIAPSLLPAEWLKSLASLWRPYRDNWEFRDFISSFGLVPVEPAPDHKGNPRITVLNIPVGSPLKITQSPTWEIIWTEVATPPGSTFPKVIELWGTREEYLWFCGGISHFLWVGLLWRQHLYPGRIGEKDHNNQIWQTGHIKHK